MNCAKRAKICEKAFNGIRNEYRTMLNYFLITLYNVFYNVTSNDLSYVTSLLLLCLTKILFIYLCNKYYDYVS